MSKDSRNKHIWGCPRRTGRAVACRVTQPAALPTLLNSRTQMWQLTAQLFRLFCGVVCYRARNPASSYPFRVMYSSVAAEHERAAEDHEDPSIPSGASRSAAIGASISARASVSKGLAQGGTALDCQADNPTAFVGRWHAKAYGIPKASQRGMPEWLRLVVHALFEMQTILSLTGRVVLHGWVCLRTIGPRNPPRF